MELSVVADGLARRLHFRGEIGVHTVKLGEGEGRNLDIIASFLRGIARDEALPFQSDAEADKRGDVCQTVACCFGEKWDSPGGAGVDLDDVDILPLIDDELDVKETADPDADSELFRVIKNRLFDTRR